PVLLGLLRRLRAEEDRVVLALVVAERQESVVAQLLLASLREADLGRALEVEVAVVAREHVRGKPVDAATVLGAADRRAPAGLRERAREHRSEHPRGVHPAVLIVRNRDRIAVLVEVDLLEPELVDRLRRAAIGKARERSRQRQGDEARILGVAERVPL